MPSAFTAGLLDAILTAYFRQIEAIEREIDDLDELAVRRRGGRLVPRRDRPDPAPDRPTAPGPRAEPRGPAPARAAGLRAPPISAPSGPASLQRLERAIDGVENARELLVGSFDLYLGRASQRTNDVMKVLTLVSSIALPAVVLAGVMGMNFKLPFFDESTNFFVVIGRWSPCRCRSSASPAGAPGSEGRSVLVHDPQGEAELGAALGRG